MAHESITMLGHMILGAELARQLIATLDGDELEVGTSVPEMAELVAAGLRVVQNTPVLHPSWETTTFLGHKRQFVATRTVSSTGEVTMGRLRNPDGSLVRVFALPEHAVIKTLTATRALVSHSQSTRQLENETAGSVAACLALEGGIAFYTCRFTIEALLAAALERDATQSSLLAAALLEYQGGEVEEWVSSESARGIAKALEAYIRRADVIAMLDFHNGEASEATKECYRAQLSDRPTIKRVEIKTEQLPALTARNRESLQEQLQKRYGTPTHQNTPQNPPTVTPLAEEGMAASHSVSKEEAQAERQS
eukprot:3215019-Amphidinium_carterae.1